MFLKKIISVSALGLALIAPAFAAEPVSASFFGQTAIGGKDTVSYFDTKVRSTHQVAEGVDRFEVQHLGATWRFASKESATKFASNPAAYIPEYNGFCSNALSIGEGLVKTNGTVWEFFGDKLHLFYAEAGRKRWVDGDWKAYNQEAAKAWEAILKKG